MSGAFGAGVTIGAYVKDEGARLRATHRSVPRLRRTLFRSVRAAVHCGCVAGSLRPARSDANQHADADQHGYAHAHQHAHTDAEQHGYAYVDPHGYAYADPHGYAYAD